MLLDRQVSAGLLILLAFVFSAPASGLAQGFATMRIAYLSQVAELPPKLSNFDLPPEDEGARGGHLAIKDNNTTGRFVKQAFEFHDVSVPPVGDAVAAFKELLARGYRFVLLNVAAERLVEMADLPEAAKALIFNAATRAKPADFDKIAAYIKGPDFELAGFKGQKLTVRAWNGQLRQPVLLAAPKALVSVSPQQGYPHQRSHLDTLGYDESESIRRMR